MKTQSKWTRKLPSKDGYYWFKSDSLPLPRIVLYLDDKIHNFFQPAVAPILQLGYWSARIKEPNK